ncbi:MAG: hypothetical protein ACTSQP_09685 [Promethearchaeota archaeon]
MGASLYYMNLNTNDLNEAVEKLKSAIKLMGALYTFLFHGGEVVVDVIYDLVEEGCGQTLEQFESQVYEKLPNLNLKSTIERINEIYGDVIEKSDKTIEILKNIGEQFINIEIEPELFSSNAGGIKIGLDVFDEEMFMDTGTFLNGYWIDISDEIVTGSNLHDSMDDLFELGKGYGRDSIVFAKFQENEEKSDDFKWIICGIFSD